MDSEWDGVQADLHRIRSLLLQRRGALVNMTADEGTLTGAQRHVEGFLSALPAEAAMPASWSQMLPAMNEAIVVPTQVGQSDVLKGMHNFCTSWACNGPGRFPHAQNRGQGSSAPLVLAWQRTSLKPGRCNGHCPLALQPSSRYFACCAAEGALLLFFKYRAPGSDGPRLVCLQVNYVGKGANLYEDAGYQLSGASYVVNKHLGTTWIWDRVRVSGGAYGGFTDFDTHSGMFTYLSYRDPNLLKTVENYDGVLLACFCCVACPCCLCWGAQRPSSCQAGCKRCPTC